MSDFLLDWIAKNPGPKVWICDGSVEKCKGLKNCISNGGECQLTVDPEHAVADVVKADEVSAGVSYGDIWEGFKKFYPEKIERVRAFKPGRLEHSIDILFKDNEKWYTFKLAMFGVLTLESE